MEIDDYIISTEKSSCNGNMNPQSSQDLLHKKIGQISPLPITTRNTGSTFSSNQKSLENIGKANSSQILNGSRSPETGLDIFKPNSISRLSNRNSNKEISYGNQTLEDYWIETWKTAFTTLLEPLEYRILGNVNNNFMSVNSKVEEGRHQNFSKPNKMAQKHLQEITNTSSDLRNSIQTSSITKKRKNIFNYYEGESESYDLLEHSSRDVDVEMNETDYVSDTVSQNGQFSINPRLNKKTRYEWTNTIDIMGNLNGIYNIEPDLAISNISSDQIEKIEKKMLKINLNQKTKETKQSTKISYFINLKLQEFAFLYQEALGNNEQISRKTKRQTLIHLISDYAESTSPFLAKLEQKLSNSKFSVEHETEFVDMQLLEYNISQIQFAITELIQSSMNMYNSCIHNASALEKFKTNMIQLNLFLVEVVVSCSIAIGLTEKLINIIGNRPNIMFENKANKEALFILSINVANWVSGNYNETYDQNSGEKKKIKPTTTRRISPTTNATSVFQL
ncbi:hypothetical protein BB559_000393 [Furculomyces boomerangus]|uniref:Uncharacterized protein n=2 Tax=Harpellales TaxID=61421 RepID=A0A2T9Z5F9_9FUNG|nr:hypothetical protein BB559_000393 [Furculomyces boomerangus]PVZ99222.1 hypothetical protein BB558_004768 [Smittium angustum]